MQSTLVEACWIHRRRNYCRKQRALITIELHDEHIQAAQYKNKQTNTNEKVRVSSGVYSTHSPAELHCRPIAHS